MDNIAQVREWIIEYGCNPDDYDPCKIAHMIDQLYKVDYHLFDRISPVLTDGIGTDLSGEPKRRRAE